MVLIAAVGVVVVAAGVLAAVLLSGGHNTPLALRPGAGRSSGTLPHSPGSTLPSSSPSTSASPTPATGSGHVGVAASLAGNPLVKPIVTLLDQYFADINARNYAAYRALLTPQALQGLTPGQFYGGYRSTKDTSEMLANISTANGVVAIVTFTSHQDPADSINHNQSCTDWQVSMFLQRDGSGYLIGKPPPSYRVSYSAC
jgi:hypothetical protein